MIRPPLSSDLAQLVERVRNPLTGMPLTERHMFGGITFLHRGNMLCCVSNKGLMVRVGKEAEPEALARPQASRCMGTGRPMAGFIMVEPGGLSRDKDLTNWLALALAYVNTLPAKKKKPLPAPARARKRKI